MLTLRRISILQQYLHPLSGHQYRFKSRTPTNDDDSKPQSARLNEELFNFERRNANPNRTTFKNRKPPVNDSRTEKKQSPANETRSAVSNQNQMGDLLRALNRKNYDQQKRSTEERQRSSANERPNFAKPFDPTEKRQRRDGGQSDQKPKKTRPHVILDTESNEVKTLTRDVADALTPPNAPQESSNIEQELLDVLRGHRVVSKNARRMEKTFEAPPPTSAEPMQSDGPERSSTRRRPRAPPDAAVEQTTEAFSSLLRDIKLKPSRGAAKLTREEDFIREAVNGSMVQPQFRDNREQNRDGSESRRPMRDNRRRQEFMRPYQLWSGEPLGIFTSKDSPSAMSPMWEKYEQDELTRISSIPPRNAFEEMIRWTKDGILWKFPIDNEQDVGAEADVPFYEHVLLERHLHDFPASPLIRQFMELVCVGLGRNPYWTAQQKLEHIDWFRTFFNEKMHILSETVHTGTVKTSAPPSAPKPASTYKPKPAPPPAPPKVVPVVAPPAVKAPTASKK